MLGLQLSLKNISVYIFTAMFYDSSMQSHLPVRMSFELVQQAKLDGFDLVLSALPPQF